jgi:hypothetical protein
MNDKQIIRTGLAFEHTYDACMECHIIWLFIATSAIIALMTEDGGAMNAYNHAEDEGTFIYLIVDEVFQAFYKDQFGI